MTTVSIIGKGNMGTAIGGIVAAGGNTVEYVGRDASDPITGDIVVLAVPHTALDEIVAMRGADLAGKIVVDITNPLNFETFDSLVVPADSSRASLLAQALPESRVLKAFNTNFASTLASGSLGSLTTTVLIAGDDHDAKAELAGVVASGGLRAIDAGSLKRARELESLGFLQITLAANEKVSWTGGLGVVLGPVGPVVASGFTGGVIYLLEPYSERERAGRWQGVAEGEHIAERVHKDANIGPLSADDENQLRAVLEEHARETGSHRATELLADWASNRARFHKLTPKPL